MFYIVPYICISKLSNKSKQERSWDRDDDFSQEWQHILLNDYMLN